ncbi:MAG TPA: circularly permuted type 2 ATP-grasp protein [Bryobacteraceae bacterium]|nr:circularly permuted type 2 ATP-grasp protein [Bryobacteraceae bacterium]
MKTVADIGYQPAPGVYDEMSRWDSFLGALAGLGADEIGRRWKTAEERIRENGVSYNVYGDPLGIDRPWNLDAIPLLISPAEWRVLEAGLIQRATLLNRVLADIYGPQELLKSGVLPPALVFANPGFWRPCHNLRVPGNQYLHLLAVDLARSPAGQWWVLSDRTQAPSGAGYALENRIVLAETFTDLFREFQVRRLASFFYALRNNIQQLSPSGQSNPRVILLTPGPLNETYFEHSYLARYLGFTLAQGSDLTVRDSRVFLKTLEGLKQVDVILRRVDDGFCDPIELRSDSFLGVAGLVEAARAGNVSIANALGSGLIEASALMPFLPGLSERLLGEKLQLPSVATWWCGQPAALDYVRRNLDDLVVKPAFRGPREAVFGGRLSADERQKTLDLLEERPWDFSGQELMNLSCAPVWSEFADGTAGSSARRVVLRVYIAAVGDSWMVMPGGLARVSTSLDSSVVSMQHGGGSKDTWVISETPVDPFSMRQNPSVPVKINRGGTSDLSSRAADFLFWLGRYSERCEHLARVLRCLLTRLTRDPGRPGTPEWDSLMALHDCLESPNSRLTGDDPQGHLDVSRDFEQEILSLIFEEHRHDSLSANLNRASFCAAQVRDRVSSDMLRAVSQLNSLARVDSSSAWGYVSPGDAQSVLNRCIATLSSLCGIELENITRGPGWHFLGLGRRIERSVQLAGLLRGVIVPLTPHTWPMLEMLLEVADSSMTYRARYFETLQAAPVLDLLMNDELNPRSLAFQLQDLAGHCRYFASSQLGAEWPVSKQNRLEEAASYLLGVDVGELCANPLLLDELLTNLESALPAFSDALTNIYFSHALMERAT